jgi:transglutaminase-like putative cysteine protease
MYAAPQVTSFASLPLTYDAIQTQPGEEYATVVTVRSNEVLTQGDSYGATSSVSVADAPSLRMAGVNYPAWIGETYLQIPDSITDRTYKLAATIAAPHNNPYDIAWAIEDYLRRNITYNERVPPPPEGVEPVDYVLFESQQGYCTYYASAMMIMLRSQGIPARVAAGFALGTYDPITGAYRVLESDAHTWVEVYFPGYGWVEFEPTAAETPIIRAETALPPEPFVAEVPSPNGEEAPTLDNPAGDAASPPAENEPEPLAETQGGQSSASRPRRAVIPAFIKTVLVGIIVLALVGVGTWFWIEQRGLLKLSETARCYARMNIYAAYLGIKPRDSVTPYERASLLAEKIPEGESVIYRIARLYNEEQYGQPTAPGSRNARARQAWQAARQIFLRRIVSRFNPINRGKP